MNGKMLIALLLTMIFAFSLTGCGTSCSQSDDDDETADDDDDDSTPVPPPFVPEGAYQCEIERVYEFDDEFCSNCCEEILETGDDDDDESHEWRCNWFLDSGGQTWTLCSTVFVDFDYRTTCYSKLLRFCGHAKWRLPTLVEVEKFRNVDDVKAFVSLSDDWVWIDEPASAFREKGVSEDDLPPQLACFNFQTGEIGCTEGERYELVAGALFVWP